MDYLKFIVLLIVSECLLGIFYYFITPKSIRKDKIIDYKSLLKGFVERMFLLISLIHDYPHALTLFGTLKLATRLKRDSEGDKAKESLYNDFYLFGNFISITVAILYSYLYHKMIL
ncbi:hypothetical protein ACEN2I_16065 [Flavobacterium sp. W22_SRS_FK3]|uniref:hypothetical protein n=1 Tax=Flavobacterium sp. W22_SRS_FK3 TaxID=3240275 RepID=UPI003F910434